MTWGMSFATTCCLKCPKQPFKPDCKGICTECGQNLNLAECEHTNGRIIFDA